MLRIEGKVLQDALQYSMAQRHNFYFLFLYYLNLLTAIYCSNTVRRTEIPFCMDGMIILNGAITYRLHHEKERKK